jgi:hypothetical protein
MYVTITSKRELTKHDVEITNNVIEEEKDDNT